MGRSITTEEWRLRLEERKDALLAEVSAWPTALQAHRPADGEWSALEVLDHLVRTEVAICGEVARHVIAPRRIRVWDRAGVAMVDRAFASRKRLKVPDSVKDLISPREGLDLEGIVSEWNGARVRLAELIREAEGCRGGVFRHPVGGWMSFKQVLRFFEVHMMHHGYQLERIAAERGSTSRSR